jgi:hypothetical protein
MAHRYLNISQCFQSPILTFILLGCVFKFQLMVYENHYYLNREKYFNTTALWWQCKTQQHNLFFYFVHHIILKNDILEAGSTCLQEKKHLTWWIPYIELHSVTHWLRIPPSTMYKVQKNGDCANEEQITLWSKQHFLENKTKTACPQTQ